MAGTPTKILVATDFSTTADRAEKLAFILARRLRAELHVIHVRVIFEEPHMAEDQQLALDRLLSSTEDATLEALDRGRPSEPEFSVTTHLIKGISAAEAITETAADLGCDLIVMGTHGTGSLADAMIGSTARRVVRRSTIPVLVVRLPEE